MANGVKISKQTGVTLGALFVLLGALITGVLAFTRWATADATWKIGIERDLGVISQSMGDHWSKADMRLWTSETERANPDWDGADVDRIPPS